MSASPDVVVRRADVLWRRCLDAVLVRPPGRDEVVKLTGSGVALWEVLAAPVGFGALCEELATGHGADVATVRSDLGPVIDDLVERGVITRG